MKKVLSIAGSDSGGGAGIQADLKAIAARGVYGMSVITALTAQNTVGVQEIFEIDSEFVGKQIDSVMSDMGADVWKSGMLSNAQIINIVAGKAHEYNIENFIVDPVMVSRSGDSLLKQAAVNSLIEQLIPISYVITPNHYEAQVIIKKSINNLKDAKKAARIIYELGAKHVVIKGGHIPNIKNAIDIFYDGREYIEIKSARIETKNTHGTGCTYASTIAAEVAKGNKPLKAVKIAKKYLTKLLQDSIQFEIGKGNGPLNHFFGEQVKLK
ncbi:MAG: bifunctional hydroxymethylpyrimidine kinase/phosphomethylpyrimidine kinase [Candidatus Lokiarchaeota archaeon]|nr:bifunctional hydroxymethylpyrimidine kinase/phosphomethylpyrimidine kinase [Candidatus Lokiarchaeota archaeon]